MRFYVGITDGDWFHFLKERQPDEVNFWRPSARSAFRVLDLGAPFLFKLHKQDHFVVGAGFFSGYSRVPLSMAWQAFREKNGTPDFYSLKRSISSYREKHGLTTTDPEIGCIVLSNPFFFDEADWIMAPQDWGAGIMQGKTYEDHEPAGHALWAEVRSRLIGDQPTVDPRIIREITALEGPVLGRRYLRTVRLGQGAFRLMTLENYDRRCCITGETTVPVLEAAHIKPVTQEGNHALRNGLLMRSDMHILYDNGLIGIDPDYNIHVSSQIRDLYVNGKVYYAHEGERLRSLPKDPELRPDPKLLEWHMDEVFAA